MVKCSINKLFKVIYINKLFNQYISIFIQIKLSKFKKVKYNVNFKKKTDSIFFDNYQSEII